jgi:hypothetical protein
VMTEEAAVAPQQVGRYTVYRWRGLLAIEGELHDGIAPGVVRIRDGAFLDRQMPADLARPVATMVVPWDHPDRVAFVGPVPMELTGALVELFIGDWVPASPPSTRAVIARADLASERYEPGS